LSEVNDLPNETARLTGTPGYGVRAAQVGALVAAEDGAARAAGIVMDRLTSRYLP
jgi:hypothetical protein